MYHFIRRFFIFVLVFACCFILPRSARPQYSQAPIHSPFGPGPPGPRPYGTYTGGYGGIKTMWDDGGGIVGSQLASSTDWGYEVSVLPTSIRIMQGSSVLDQFQQAGGILPIVQTFTQPYGQSLFSGSTSSILDRTGLQFGTRMQYGPRYLGSQSYIASAYDMAAYGFPISSPANVNFSQPSTFPTMADVGARLLYPYYDARDVTTAPNQGMDWFGGDTIPFWRMSMGPCGGGMCAIDTFY